MYCQKQQLLQDMIISPCHSSWSCLIMFVLSQDLYSLAILKCCIRPVLCLFFSELSYIYCENCLQHCENLTGRAPFSTNMIYPFYCFPKVHKVNSGIVSQPSRYLSLEEWLPVDSTIFLRRDQLRWKTDS